MFGTFNENKNRKPSEILRTTYVGCEYNMFSIILFLINLFYKKIIFLIKQYGSTIWQYSGSVGQAAKNCLCFEN